MIKEIVESETKLYSTSFVDGTTIFFRLLTLEEYTRLQTYQRAIGISDLDLHEYIYNLCVLPLFKDIGGTIKAGVPSSIGAFIYKFSVDTSNVEEEIEKARYKYLSNELLSFLDNLKQVICLAFPSYTYDQLDKKTKLEIIELFTRAEKFLVTKTKGEYQPINVKTLRSAPKSSTIDFEKENREIKKAGLNKEDTPWGRNMDAFNLKQIKEKAAARASRRS